MITEAPDLLVALAPSLNPSKGGALDAGSQADLSPISPISPMTANAWGKGYYSGLNPALARMGKSGRGSTTATLPTRFTKRSRSPNVTPPTAPSPP